MSSFRPDGHSGRRKIVVHVTSPEIADLIQQTQFKPGSKGMLGPGIYFADCVEDAAYKAINKGAYLQCTVEVGVSLLLTGKAGHTHVNEDLVKRHGCESIHWINPPSGDEWVVYSPSKITIMDIRKYCSPPSRDMSHIYAFGRQGNGRFFCFVCGLNIPPTAPRFHCLNLNCRHVDLCGKCHEDGLHNNTHRMQLYPKSDSWTEDASQVNGLGRYVCDVCGERIPPTESRSHCLTCHNYDLCSDCRFRGTHDKTHRMGFYAQSESQTVATVSDALVSAVFEGMVPQRISLASLKDSTANEGGQSDTCCVQ